MREGTGSINQSSAHVHVFTVAILDVKSTSVSRQVNSNVCKGFVFSIQWKYEEREQHKRLTDHFTVLLVDTNIDQQWSFIIMNLGRGVWQLFLLTWYNQSCHVRWNMSHTMGLCHFPPHPMNNPWPQRHRQQLWVLSERLSLKQTVKTVFTCTQQEGEKSCTRATFLLFLLNRGLIGGEDGGV